ncbi:MAG: TetR/AcrR family transcriptional regulator [Candidatus Heimdallarchaeota archaeon]
MPTSKTNSRNRSFDKKEKQLQKIIQKGLALFIKDGSNMSMRNLAKQLDIVVSGLYKYVNNKRELWFACTNKVFAQLSEEWSIMEKEHTGTDLELIGNIGASFLEISIKDFPLFKFMFLQEPPRSNRNKPGPFELENKRAGFTNLFEVVSRATESRELKTSNPMYFSLALWGFVLGPAIITSPMHSHFFDRSQSEAFELKEFHLFIYQLIQQLLYRE